MYFLKSIIILQAFLSMLAFAETDAQNVVLRYKKAMITKDREAVKETVTENYYKSLNKNDALERLFKESRPSKSKYNVEIIESKVVKNGFMAKVTDKEDQSIEWYKLKKTSKGFKIEKQVSDH